MTTTVFSKEIDLVLITSDTDRLPTYMYVVVDENQDIIEFGKKDLDAEGKVMSRMVFSQLDQEGVVLKKKKGRKIVIMRGHNCDPVLGGALELDFLYNGITNSRKKFHMELVRDNDEWKIHVKDQPVSHLHFKVHRKRFVGVIGIKRVQIVK